MIFRKRRHVPIIGVQGAGKSYFIVTLASFVAKHGWGYVDAPHIYDMVACVQAMKPIPPTIGMIPVRVDIDMVKYMGHICQKKVRISTGDISGKEFEQAIEEAKTLPDIDKLSPSLKKFVDILKKTDGLLVLIDITRYMDKTPDKVEAVLKSFSEQISPIANAIELAMKLGMKEKPIFFVFSKKDIHKMEVDEIRRIFEPAWCILLRRLEACGIKIGYYTISAAGWSSLDDLDTFFYGQGFDKLLYDLVVTI
ncbi:hypothetical protein DRN63_05245 [Nanoarchaeota archaeon]|nr:MAG: hypothetical protein DRN63_05245 [Nanoarchaeota archaeon]